MMDERRTIDRLSSMLVDEKAVDSDAKTIYRGDLPFPDIKQYLEDDYYMGKVAKDLYPSNVPDMLDIFRPGSEYIEVILTGGTSIGKTFMTSLALTYMIGKMCHFRNPHHFLGASPTSPIVLVNMSINAQKAKEVIFTRVKTMVDSSPFFREKLPRDMRLQDTLVWRLSERQEDAREHTGPQLMFKPGTGDSLSALGDDIFAGAGDELNFFRVIEKSKRAFGEALDPAQRLYDVISRRMKGRFSTGGLTLGKFFLLSSAQYPDDFIERRIREAEESGEMGRTVKLIRKSIWEAKRGVMISGRPVFGHKVFRVEVGSSRRGSRLLDVLDKKTGQITALPLTDATEGKVIEPPTELYDDFSRDVEGSVRDFAGEVTRAISPFFTSSEVLYEAIYLGLEHPWSKDETTLQDGSELRVKYMFQYDEVTKRWRPSRAPARPRYVHVDLAKSGDACGLAVVHIADWVTNMRTGRRIVAPVYEMDMALRVVAPRGGEIIFDRVLDVIRILRNHGMNIRKVTYDSWQSVHSLQKLKSEGFSADTVSVDKEASPYVNLKDAFFDKRMRIYNYDILLTELMRLEKKGEKIDHPVNGSKDVSDALCGAVWDAFMAEGSVSPDALEARLPQTSKPANILIDRQEHQRIQTQRDAEEELASWMGGSRIVR